MKQSEFLKWLKSQGVKTENGKKHLRLYYKGKISHLPRHGSQELTTGLVEGVKKQLGLISSKMEIKKPNKPTK